METFKQIVVLFVILASTAEGNFVMMLCCNRFTGMSRLLHGLLSLQICSFATARLREVFNFVTQWLFFCLFNWRGH